jgi:hypothetical protein
MKAKADYVDFASDLLSTCYNTNPKYLSMRMSIYPCRVPKFTRWELEHPVRRGEGSVLLLG